MYLIHYIQYKISLKEEDRMSVDTTALFKISYGLYLLTSKLHDKHNGCIINTATQLTSNPITLSVAVNKQNYTHDMIMQSGKLNISVLTESAPFDLYKHFGFQSGRTTDKFSGFEGAEISENGLYYLTKNCSAVISCNVVHTVDCQTHTLFIVSVSDAVTLSDEAPVTYEYYQKNVKQSAVKPEEKKSGYVCKVCGYVYEGEPLPEDFICPWCKHPASDFEKL